ncbi:MAG TPA: hypothetical protein VM778_13295 [Gemmatimonadota bacterium]|nr:hypothetical protein [Gemmatimonadota bacterium]
MGLPLLAITALAALAGAVALVPGPGERRARVARWTGLGLGAWLAVYAGVLVAVSLASEERVLAPGAPKRFCGAYLDCHLGVEVVGVERNGALGEGPGRIEAEGEFHVVTVAVSSDARRATLALRHPRAVVRDGAGTEHERNSAAEAALGGPWPSLSDPVAAGEKRAVRLVFDLPADVPAPRLHVTEGSRIERLVECVLIGDEDSLLHAPVALEL